MKKLILIILLTALPSFAYGAGVIFRDAQSTVNTTADPVEFTHTGSSTSTLGILGFNVDAAADNLVGVPTWGGTDMTELSRQERISAPGERFVYLFYITNPPTGAQTISINFSASELVRGCAETYTATDTTDAIDGNVTSTVNTATTITTTFTTTQDDSYLFNWTTDYSGTPSAGTNENDSTVVANHICSSFDGGTAGSHAMTTNSSGNTEMNAAMGASIIPSVAVAAEERRRMPIIIFGGILLPAIVSVIYRRKKK